MRTPGDRIWIRPLPKDTISAGGVIIPDSANGKPTKAEVILIGDDPKIGCVVGDLVLFPEHAGFEFNWEGSDLKVIRWTDIQMILDRDVKSAQQLLKENIDPIIVEEKINEGMTNEMFVLDISGQKFHLQGNVLMPVIKPKEQTNATP